MRFSSFETGPSLHSNLFSAAPMSLAYTLLLDSDAAPEDVRRHIAGDTAFERVGDALRSQGVTVTVSETPAFVRMVARDESDLNPSILVGLDLHREYVDVGTRVALALSVALAHRFGGDALLKYLGDYPILARRQGKIVVDPGWARTHPDLVAHLGEPTARSPLPGERWA